MKTAAKKYEKANQDLLMLFKEGRFDIEKASRIIADIDDINAPVLDTDNYPTTYLFEAQQHNNVEAVRFLLEHGADPNLDLEELINGCALVDLHFLWDEMHDQREQRLEIARLFFEFGADPNLWYEGETLYDHILWEVFYHEDTPHDWDYLKKFFIMLLAYGGGSGLRNCEKPNLLEPIYKKRIFEYDFQIVECEDGCGTEGHLLNPDGVVIAVI